MVVGCDHDPNQVTFHVNGANLPGGTVDVVIDLFQDGVWLQTDGDPVTIVNGDQTIGPVDAGLPNGTYLFRLRSGEILSNEFELVVNCGGGGTIGTGLCAGEYHIVSVDADCDTNLVHLTVNVITPNDGFGIGIFYRPVGGPTWFNARAGRATPLAGVHIIPLDDLNIDFPANGDYELKITCCDDDSCHEDRMEYDSTTFTVNCPVRRFNTSYMGFNPSESHVLDVQCFTLANADVIKRSLLVWNVTDGVQFFYSETPDTSDSPSEFQAVWHIPDFEEAKEYYFVYEAEDADGLKSFSTGLIKFIAPTTAIGHSTGMQGLIETLDHTKALISVDAILGAFVDPSVVYVIREVAGLSTVPQDYFAWTSENMLATGAGGTFSPAPFVEKTFGNGFDLVEVEYQRDLTTDFPLFCALQPFPYLQAIGAFKII